LTATHTHQSHNLKRLEFLQRYAFVVQLLSFSSSEAMSLLAFHGKYGIRYVEGTRDIPIFQLNFQNLQTLFDLSQFLQTFEDDQNHFIFYLNSAKETENETRNAEDLSQITDWDVDQIRFLLLQWTDDPYFNISHMSGVVHMWQWFDLAEKMNLSIPLLWKIYQLAEVAAPTYEDFSEVADIIWGGWIKKYEEEADVLSDLTNTVNQNLRDHLLPLVISQVNQDHPELNILTPRDLYQYLLIDVEVNGVVQTSRIKEAISAIQLYLYRSLNNLEKDIVISQEDYIEFSQWWEWMRNYRVWQANREVFLYPENYIEPELRANVTPQFEQLVNDLKQVDLTNPAAVDEAYLTYLDGFSTVASLQVVGAAAQNRMPNSGANESLTKELCIIGKTADQPYSYYYRTVLLAQTVDAENTNPYAPTDWGAWQEINCHMQPIGPVTPVFAFGKWFVFWVERQEVSDTSVINKDADENYVDVSETQYEFTILYSYLDFNQNWIAAQKVAEPIAKSVGEVNTLWASSELAYLDRTYPTFFNSTQTIIIPYGEDYVFEISEGTLSQGVEKWTRFEGINTSYLGDASLGALYGGQHQTYQYGSNFGPYYSPLPKTGTLTLNGNTIHSNGVVDICEYEGKLYCAWNDNNTSIKFGYLNESYEVQDSVNFDYSLVSVSPALIEYNDRLYVFGVNNSSQLFYGWIDTNTNTINDTVNLLEILDPSGSPIPSLAMGTQMALAVFNDSIYIHFMGNNSLSYLGVVSEDSLINVFQTSGPAQLNGVGLQTFEDKLFFYVGNTSNTYIYQFSLDKYGQIQAGGDEVMKSNGLNVTTNYSPSLGIDNDQMVFAWTDIKDDTHLIKYGYFNPNPDLNNILSGEVSTENKSNNRPNIKPYRGDLYMIWADVNTAENIFRLPLTLYTLSLWFQLNQGASGPQPILSDATKNIVALSVEEDPTGMLTFTANDGTTTTTAKVQGETWNHVVVTLANGVSSLYCNGILLSSTIPAIPLPDSLILGQLPTEKQNFLGVFQEVLFYTRSLVAGEVTELYTNGVQQITYDFEANTGMKTAFRGNFEAIPVLGQPNWNILTNDEAEYLSMVSQTSKALNVGSYRLNTTTENTLSQLLMIGGTDNLLTTSAQTSSEVPFSNLLPAPSASLTFSPIPSDQMDFLYGGMTPYFWEIFFYSPFLMAHMLQTDQQYQAAKDWYQKIFDPTMRSTAPFTYENDLYWQFLGLRSENNPTLKNELDETWAVETQMDLTDPVQLAAYHNDPFDPHAIARLRPIAYQKSLVLHYIDNLINWGDMLFTQYSMESILEAMMLYVMAYDLLGPQPESQGPCDLPQALTLGEILSDIGDKSKKDEFLINLEQSQAPVVLALASNSPNNYIPGDYFGLPENDQFTTYWNTLEDRLNDIRNSLNIQGQFQQAPLFQPALNPMQLVQQVASGQSVAQALSAIQTSIPFYRFEVMIEKSKALASSVTQLGQSLLAALEKKDAEQLSMLYNTNQQNILSLTETSREDQIKGAQQTILALQAGLSNAQHRLDHYTNLINEGWSSGEEAQVALTSASIPLSAIAQIFKGTAIFGYSVPTIFGFSNGGFNPGDAITQTASVLESSASILQTSAQLSGTIAGFQRRLQDWQLQQTLAQDDVNNAQSQITSAQYALTQAQQELSILKTNLQQEQYVAEFLRTKFTSQQMYQWMVGRLAAIYFQAYQLAMDFAQQAQKAFQFEQGNQQVFIQKNYWNNLYQGLLTGESLKLDLDRMEMSYMKQNERRYEIEKVISLSQLDPSALRDLKDRKKCTISLTEQNFDEDYPGHYCRQIKSISISMPIVLGPYQTIKATLTQTSNYTILEEDLNAVKYLRGGRGDQPDASILRVDVRANQQVALSQGLNDSGLFQLNFNDPRYLPFEGTGAISSWVLEMNGNNNPDLENLTDVIIRLQYTSKQGSQSFQQGVSDI